jgi:D-tyrosyl-tRNA(Tyr) deacylase
MRVVIQRVKQARVEVDNEVVGSIEHGLLILLGIEHDDTQEDAEWLAQKIVAMRIFSDEEDKMNKDVRDVNGNMLLVSQFTLHAATKKGNRPSFIKAARPEKAIPLYEKMGELLTSELGKQIQYGQFGAMMDVILVNDGPVTIIMDSKVRE